MSTAHVPASPVGAGARIDKPVVSWLELKHQHVIMQSRDYSCGSGSLATLMRYYFADDVDEDTVLVEILESLSDEELEVRLKKGFSMLDLKQCALRMGYQAEGVRLSYANLAQLQGPVLVHVNRRGVTHFAVLRGVRGDRVFLADPSQGNLSMTVHQFEKEWTRVALILGKEGFGLPQDHLLTLSSYELVANNVLAARRALYLGR